MTAKEESGRQGIVEEAIRELSRLPGVGPKSAERITHYLLGADEKQVFALADAIRRIKENLRRCVRCHHIAEHELCSICADPRRDAAQICVVETSRDLGSLERAGVYRGVYHVLLGRLAPLENMGPECLTADSLLRRVQQGGVKEIILATNPTLEGDGTALYVSSLLAPTGVKITRLARGLPSGSALEFANKEMLAEALEGRRAL